jgi:hypothetical protein
MILLFGQHPQGSMAARQYPLHARVGSVGDVAPSPVLPPSPGGGGGGGGWIGSGPYIRRSEILLTPPEIEEDLILALTAFILVETENHS